MALNRVWTPSGNHSSGGTKRLIVIHDMEGFTGPNGAYDCAKYFQTDCGASSHVCIDNNRGTIWECVSRSNSSWTQCGFNSQAVSVEQSGFASWSTDYWLTNREPQLRNVAEWIAEESKALGIPIVKLTSSQAQSNGKGVCFHSDLGSTGCGHSDPGNGWPLNQVLEWAKGGSIPPETVTEMAGINMPAVEIVNGKLHQAAIWENGEPHYQFEDQGWYPLDMDRQFKAKSGCDITANHTTGLLVISLTGLDGNEWTWQQRIPDPGDGPALKGKWGKYNRGGYNSIR